MSQPAANRPTAGALGAKTARACDSCLVRRARWYCAADDAFLCQPCDNSVHSANPLARRHERVRLKTASSSSSSSSACCFKPSPYGAGEDEPAPAWHHGCKRKARTPRGAGAKVPVEQKGDACGLFGRSDTIVPDLDLALLEDLNVMEEEEQLLYRVPILDPVLADLCSRRSPAHEARMAVQPRRDQPVQDLTGFLASPEASCIPDFELDVESLLGRGGDDAFSMEELGLVGECLESVPMVKKEEEEDRDNCALLDRELKVDVDTCLESIDICFDVAGTPEDEKPMIQGERRKKRRRIMLDLNYDGVISAWDNLSSPWIDGTRPQFDPDVLSPDYMWGGGGEVAPMTHHAACTGGRDGGREARVSRYREKRRTRLFSKKIRYEVRKLNAEKRPRMKGRFVKRTSLLSSNGHGVIGQPQYVC